MKSRTLIQLVLTVGLSLALATGAQAFTFGLDVSGMPAPSGVEGFKVTLALPGDFSMTPGTFATGNALPTPVPGVHIAGWIHSSGVDPAPAGGSLVVDMINGDAFDFLGTYDQNNLLNGTLFTFDFTGGAPTFESLQLFTNLGTTATAAMDSVTVNTQVTPIPGSVLLLGSGLAGFLGIRRKLRS